MLKSQAQTATTAPVAIGQRNDLMSGHTLGLTRIALSIQEAVVASGLSRSYLYEAMSRGELPFIKKGKRRLIPAAALSEYVLHSDE